MSSFTGVSVITDGWKCTAPAVDAGTDSGYHLLVVVNYSSTVQKMPNGYAITSGSFMVGGHKWHIQYYPNGNDPSCANFISFGLALVDVNVGNPLKAHFGFSFIDEVEYQKPMCIRATEPHSFSSKVRGCGFKKFMKRDAFERSVHLNGDSFTIRCDITVCKDLNSSHDADGAMPDIHQHFDYLLQNKVGADVTFKVNGETFAAHRCVLAARSKVFMAQLFGPRTEATTSTVIQIKDMEAKMFAALLRFIYTDSFPENDEDNGMEEEARQDEEEYVEEGKGEEEMWLQDLLVAADRYDLQRLKFLCGKRLSEHIGVSSVASTLALAEQHHCHGLKEACFNFIQVQSPECLDEVMATDGWEHMSTTYPSILKELVAKLVSNQKKDTKRKWSSLHPVRRTRRGRNRV